MGLLAYPVGMKRRSFLSSLCGLVAAPLVAREVEVAPVALLKPRQPGWSWGSREYVIPVEWHRDVIPAGKPHVALFVGADGSRELLVREGGRVVRRYRGSEVAEGLRLAKLGKA